MASEGKAAGGAGGGGGGFKLGGLKLDIPREETEKLFPEELRGYVDSGACTGKEDDRTVAVYDCRNADYEGGTIPGAEHIPFDPEKVKETIPGLVSKNADKKKVVFVCLYGEQRSPAIATAYAVHQAASLPEGEGPTVCVLIGGFARYLRENWEERTNTAVVAGFDPDQWLPEDGAEGRWVHRSTIDGSA